MSVLTFQMIDLKRLSDEIADAPEFKPTIGDLYNPENHVDGIILDTQGRSELRVKEAKGVFFPSAKNLRKGIISPCLQIVGDGGVYLMTNAEFGDNSTPTSRGSVVYAKGCNPESDEDYDDRKRALWGCDDGTIKIPSRWIALAEEKGKRVFRVRLSSDQVTLML